MVQGQNEHSISGGKEYAFNTANVVSVVVDDGRGISSSLESVRFSNIAEKSEDVRSMCASLLGNCTTLVTVTQSVRHPLKCVKPMLPSRNV